MRKLKIRTLCGDVKSNGIKLLLNALAANYDLSQNPFIVEPNSCRSTLSINNVPYSHVSFIFEKQRNNIHVLVSWCNGSIVDFESIDGGSIPPETVNLRRAKIFCIFEKASLFVRF